MNGLPKTEQKKYKGKTVNMIAYFQGRPELTTNHSKAYTFGRINPSSSVFLFLHIIHLIPVPIMGIKKQIQSKVYRKSIYFADIKKMSSYFIYNCYPSVISLLMIICFMFKFCVLLIITFITKVYDFGMP